MNYFKSHVRKNRMLKSVMISLFVFCTSFSMYAQSPVKGVVTDEQGEPVFAASVFIEGSQNMVASDLDGKYVIENVENGDVIVFDYLGKKSVKIVYSGQSEIDVVMYEDRTVLDDVVVVGYGTQKRQSITGAVSKVDGGELLRLPNQNLSNMLGGVVPGVVSYQSSGVPGGDGASLLVRGSGVKCIVDGVERDFAQLNPEEIESISVLKDASAAAIYGFNAESVIIVTTKRGDNSPSRISYRGSFNVSQNATSLDLLDGPEFAYWYNLGRQMDGNEPVFSQRHVEMMTNGDDSDGWANTDWYKNTFGIGFNQSHTVSATGGNDRINYFASLGYYRQDGNVDGYTFDRINVRTNIEAKIARNLTFNMNITGRFTNTSRPSYAADSESWLNIGQQVMRAHPYVPVYYNGYVVSTRTDSAVVSPEGALNESGYSKTIGNVFESTASLTYQVPFIKGLSLKALVAYDVSHTTGKSLTTPFETMVAYMPTSVDGDISYALSLDSRGSDEAVLGESLGRSTKLLTNISAQYNREFGKHSVDVLALMETNKYDYNSIGATGYGLDVYELDELDLTTNKTKNSVSGNSSLSRNVGIVGRVNYSYDNKYLVEISCRYDGSSLFSGSTPGARWAPFPAASLGWRIDREKWFKNSNVDILKLRAGTGLTGSTGGISPWVYLNTMQNLLNTAIIGGEVVSSFYTSNPANIYLTWQKTWQSNVGVDLSMWNGMFRTEIDLFYKYIYDMVAPVANEFPASWGSFYYAQENRNKQDHKGFEFLFEHRNRVGDFSYNISLVGTYAFRRWLSYVDAANTPDYQKITGTEVGAQVGFIAVGLFQSEEEIANSATIEGTQALPGDIKYLDRNGDGKITYEQDRGIVASTAYPRFEGGLNFGFSWKGIDFSMNWTTGLGRTVALTGVYSSGVMDHTSMTRPFYHGGNSPKYLVENSWTEDNRDARFPRLSVNPSNNNAYSSTWWYENGNYLRLKNMQIGYSLPKKWMDAIGLRSCRIFLEGTNLLTFSKLMKYNIDPETPGVSNGYYPQQRLMGVGLDIQF